MSGDSESFKTILEDSLVGDHVRRKLSLRLRYDSAILAVGMILFAWFRDTDTVAVMAPLLLLTGFLTALDYACTYCNLRIVEFYELLRTKKLESAT